MKILILFVLFTCQFVIGETGKISPESYNSIKSGPEWIKKGSYYPWGDGDHHYFFFVKVRVSVWYEPEVSGLGDNYKPARFGPTEQTYKDFKNAASKVAKNSQDYRCHVRNNLYYWTSLDYYPKASDNYKTTEGLLLMEYNSTDDNWVWLGVIGTPNSWLYQKWSNSASDSWTNVGRDGYRSHESMWPNSDDIFWIGNPINANGYDRSDIIYSFGY